MPEAALRALEVVVRRRVEGVLAGDYRSPHLGEGTELAQVRAYQPGDNVRAIDWNVTARTGDPHVREHVAERALATWLVLDGSPSMDFGTADRRKADVAEGVALALGHVATRRGNHLGVVAFGGPAPRVLPPRQGRAGLLGLLGALRTEAPASGAATSLHEGLRLVNALGRRRGLVAVISDFRGPRDWQPQLVQLAARHELLAIEIRDPREQELPDVGELWLVDPETGRHLRVDTARPRLRRRFADAAAAERAEVAARIRASGADHFVLSTDGDWLRALTTFLASRGTRR
jgi:uncharacterized protein (DUF58 family)